VLGKHNQQPVVNLDGPKNLLVKFLAAFEVFRSKPNPHIGLSHARMKSPGKFVIFGRIADETERRFDC
jgi:hypothetical protein